MNSVSERSDSDEIKINNCFCFFSSLSLQDGCDFVCRSRKREESPAYRGVATDNLQEEPEERDDHLLPM